MAKRSFFFKRRPHSAGINSRAKIVAVVFLPSRRAGKNVQAAFPLHGNVIEDAGNSRFVLSARGKAGTHYGTRRIRIYDLTLSLAEALRLVATVQNPREREKVIRA